VKGAALQLTFLIGASIRIGSLLASLAVTVAKGVGWLPIWHGVDLESSFLMFACDSPVLHWNGRINSVTPHSLLALTRAFSLICCHYHWDVVGVRAGFPAESFKWNRTGMVSSTVFLSWHDFLLLRRSPVGGLSSLPAVH
jgi:hypothetical protein